ncbi:hypothetical protein ASPVEDRAFT_125091 [Aspergillus versicolor CBS 583.65]|uniref:Zn(2)-C6 fungal-type domain-containing protein n=1 Tax=Aspergillus versicolor CBS 583.65 TaxID=1036611 RepID=A0A1L9PCM1_ASPVE|nr:uncharacterized protein ASPVEDRAFT_125091 [Aspergillus versicolor CBS 583.65]OJI99269.1 hypothetical protein ASPVEDRAFT_125091 [Aspergillus versicolor CBS 583.65]
MKQASAPVLTCSVCSETFRRAEHLKRHTLTHIDDKPHTCLFCDSRYKRSDALRRHWKTCPQRVASGIQIPKRSLSGKRKQACDQCTSRKRACSAGQPCSECSLRVTECTYNGAQALRRLSEGSSQRQPDTLADSVQSRRQRQKTWKNDDLNSHTQNAQASQTRFDFLLNFTQAAGLNEAYNYGTSQLSPVDVDFDNLASEGFPFEDSTVSNPFSCYLNEVASLWGDIDLSSLMVDKSSQLWELLSQKSNHFDLYSLDMVGFLSPQNLTRCLDLFWSRWYRHCPIIHRATFDLGNCWILLFATMALIGACMSPQQSDHQAAKHLLDVVEELIFSGPLFSEVAFTGTRKDDQLGTRQNVETLQAACFMCLLQKWEGSDSAKLRMQRHRFTSFVATTRAMGLSQATHSRSMGTMINDAQWREWILKEEMIRTFNHIFLLDSAFVIFHNAVPRMVLQEMTIDLTCPEAVFQAPTPEEFMIAIQSHPIRPTPPLLTDCIRTLCADHPDPAILTHIHSESALNLFTFATGKCP